MWILYTKRLKMSTYMVDVKPYSILNLHCNLYVDHVVVKYYIVLLLNSEMKSCTKIKLSFISQIFQMMKFIFLNATHTVSKLFIIVIHSLTLNTCIILLGAILLILLPCVLLSLINCSSSFLVVFCTSCCVFKRTVMLIYFYYK